MVKLSKIFKEWECDGWFYQKGGSGNKEHRPHKTDYYMEAYKDLSVLNDKIIRLKFYMADGDLYAFWISPWITGESRGYTSGGGPDLSPGGVDIP